MNFKQTDVTSKTRRRKNSLCKDTVDTDTNWCFISVNVLNPEHTGLLLDLLLLLKTSPSFHIFICAYLCCRSTHRPGLMPTSSRRRPGLCKGGEMIQYSDSTFSQNVKDPRADKVSAIYALLTLPALLVFAGYCWCCVDQSQTLITWLVGASNMPHNHCSSKFTRRTWRPKPPKQNRGNTSTRTNLHRWSEDCFGPV